MTWNRPHRQVYALTVTRIGEPVRGAFVEGMEFATIPEIPVVAGPEFTIYSGGNFLARTLERRPDLLERAELSDDEIRWLKSQGWSRPGQEE